MSVVDVVPPLAVLGRCSVLVILVIRPGFRLCDVKADLGRPVQCPCFHLSNEFLPGAVTGESLGWVCRSEGELVTERLQTEILVDRRLARGDQLRTGKMSGRAMYVEHVPRQCPVVKRAHL